MTDHRDLLAKQLLFPWCFVALVALALVQPATAAPIYSIVPLGLDDLEHTRSDGYKYSGAHYLNEAGQVVGVAERYDGGSTDLGQSIWLYDGATTIHIGLVGAEHARNDGYKLGVSLQLNNAGQVLGRSKRYSSNNTELGWSAWLYNGTTTIDIGLTGSEHTRFNGYKFNYAYQLNTAGKVFGFADRYNGGGILLGRSAWLYDGATTTNIGLTGVEYTGNNGYKFSEANDLNDAGHVLGYSRRYNGDGTSLGSSAWLYNGANTIEMGLTGSEHTGNDGYKSSIALDLNEAGQVTGTSRRYNGSSTSLGRTAWFYDGLTTIDIGLIGSEHTASNGYKDSQVDEVNEAGQVCGYSERYNGGNSELGRTAWLYDGATTIAIGLTGSEHTRNDGYKESEVKQLNEAGQARGVSYRFNGGASLGATEWLYNGATTIAIGLTSSEHTRNDGYKESYAYEMNETGQVLGYSRRYNGGGTELGETSWLYNGATTVGIGLTGAEHTRNDGYQNSFAYNLIEAGQVIGYSYRYNGGNSQLGRDAWLYDSALDQTFALNLSTRSDGYAYSLARYMGEDGLILGTYTLFDTFDNDLGQRAFYFTVADGLHDLGSLVEGDLPANGWDLLADAFRVNGLGQIHGQGKLTSQSGGQMVYLLTPVVPEPSTVLLVGLTTLMAASAVRRRRQ